MSRGFIVGIIIVLIDVGLPGACAQDWNVEDDFSATENPNGAWSYGWSYSLTSGFTLFDEHSTIWTLSRWKVSWGANAPVVLRNETGGEVSTCCTTWEPGQFSLHPSQGGPPNDAYCVARWTAPDAGVYAVSATFTGLDYITPGIEVTSATVHVLVNGTSHFDDSIIGDDASATYSTSVTLLAGDTVDFVVGDSGGDNYDTTALDATVSLAPTIPTVSEWGMGVMTLLVLIAGTLELSRRRGSAATIA